MHEFWRELPIWLTAFGTCGAVIVSLILSRQEAIRRERHERRQQAELVTAWLGNEPAVGRQDVIIQNASSQSVYQLIASLVGIQGAVRKTAVPTSRSQRGQVVQFQTPVGQVPPGQYMTTVASGGHDMMKRFGIELAFQDAAGVRWLRHGDGRLEEIADDPATLYNLMLPVGWENG